VAGQTETFMDFRFTSISERAPHFECFLTTSCLADMSRVCSREAFTDVTKRANGRIFGTFAFPKIN
jgi:hypothetical protein